MTNTKLTFTSLLLILIVIISAAGGFMIYFLTETPVIINPPMDKYAGYRAQFIHAGLALTVISFAIFIVSLFIKGSAKKDKLLNYFLFLLIFLVAWKSYPFWANGLHHVFSNGTTSMYDPKDLLPYTEIGSLWALPVLLFHVLILLIIPVPIMLWILDIKKNGFGKKEYFIIGSLVLITLTFFTTPHYMYWFMD